MRRKDREIVSPEFIRRTVEDCKVCRLGFNDNGEVYIIPMNFGFSVEDGGYTFYFHGAMEGRKYELAMENPTVGFEMDTDYALNEGERACSFSARFRSIIGTGILSMVESAEEKRFGLGRIMEHCTGRNGWSFEDEMLEKTAVFRLPVTKLSCKEHK